MIKLGVSVLVLAVVVGGALWYHFHSMNELRDELLEKQEQEERLNQRIDTIQGQLGTVTEEKESLLRQIEESLMEEKAVFDAGVIQEEIRKIGELATMEYRYTNVGTLDSSKKWNIFSQNLAVPFTGKSAIITMDGVLKVGIDVEGIEITSSELTKTITVRIPKAKLISNELDEESLIVYDQSGGIFNQITIEDSGSLRNEIKEKAEKNAEKSGIYQQAVDNAKTIVRCIIESIPGIKESYKIVFK